MSKVSVIIPVYNVEQYLRQAMDSIVGQTYSALEILCFDDGSTDSSGNILDEYGAKDPRIRIIHQENIGLGATRNRGICLAQGEYIFFFDSDDYLALNAIELMVTQIEKTDADVCLCNAVDFHADTGEKLKHNYIRADIIKGREVFSAEDLGADLFMVTAHNCWNRLYKKDLFNDPRLRFYEGIRYEDSYFGFLSMLSPRKITYVNKPLYFYRRKRSDSLMATDISHSCDIIDSFRNTVKNIEKDRLLRTPEMQLSFERKTNGILLFNFPFQANFSAYKAYFNTLKTALYDMNLVKEGAENVNPGDRKKQKQLLDTANAEDFLFWEYQNYYHAHLSSLQKLDDARAAVNALKTELSCEASKTKKLTEQLHKATQDAKKQADLYQKEKEQLSKSKKQLKKQKESLSAKESELAKLQSKYDEIKRKYDRLSNKWIVKTGRKIKKLLRKIF